ncbi:MAG: hypothetical protein HOQ05_04125 [Corynebacteriales bacterium]|nr:hypothetical protein [Mycobacteriales bacterium]
MAESESSSDAATHHAGSVSLPDAVRLRVISLASGVLPALSPAQIPGNLRKFRRFTASRRAKMAATPLVAALATDTEFRDHVAEKVVLTTGALGEAVMAGAPVEAADPVDVAAIAYLTQAEGWEEWVRLATPETDSHTEVERATQQLEQQLEKAKSTARSDLDKARKDLALARRELEHMREESKQLAQQLRKAERDLTKLTGDLSAERGRRAADSSTHAAEIRRLRAQLEAANVAAHAVRDSERVGRHVHSARLAVLLATINEATRGLRDELSLEDSGSPADLVATQWGATPGEPGRVGGTDELARLEQLLMLPKVHVIVDGYNVTKTGFGGISLERQRNRLVQGLAGLAAQTRAEITVVFDGTHHLVGIAPSARGVRVLFSQGAQIADELIEQLVRAEPAGRPLLVVSSDKAVANSALRAGGHAVPSQALIERLSRA